MKEDNITVRYIVAFVISLITFISGIFLGLALAKKEVYLVGISEHKIKSNLFELETTVRFLEKNICDKNLIKDFGLDLDKVGKELEKLENKIFVSKEEYRYLKNFYYALEINHFMLLEKAKEMCNESYVFILYFYRDIKECEKCYEQSLYLTTLKEKFPELVQVYSFDMRDYNKSILVKKLMLKYSIEPKEKGPVLIINGKKESFKTLHELEKLVKLNNKQDR